MLDSSWTHLVLEAWLHSQCVVQIQLVENRECSLAQMQSDSRVILAVVQAHLCLALQSYIDLSCVVENGKVGAA